MNDKYTRDGRERISKVVKFIVCKMHQIRLFRTYEYMRFVAFGFCFFFNSSKKKIVQTQIKILVLPSKLTSVHYSDLR